jgi:hypothetical protein
VPSDGAEFRSLGNVTIARGMKLIGVDKKLQLIDKVRTKIQQYCRQ